MIETYRLTEKYPWIVLNKAICKTIYILYLFLLPIFISCFVLSSPLFLFFRSFDCGIYVMVIMENFDGIMLKQFDHVNSLLVHAKVLK